jgi:sorting nexin-1/2
MKHVAYQITGIDKNGVFQVSRRYNDFLLLREKITERWPGIYIPLLPEKKMVGNTDIGFVAKRRD